MVSEFTAASLDEPTIHDPESGVVDYQCVTPCVWGPANADPTKRLWKAGERVSKHFTVLPGEEVARHFVPVKAVIEQVGEVEKTEEPPRDPGLQAIKKATSWNKLISVGDSVVGLSVNRDLTFRKAKEDLIQRYLAKKEG